MNRCSLCARPPRRGHGRVVVGVCECSNAVCARHASLVEGQIMCAKCVKKLPEGTTVVKVTV